MYLTNKKGFFSGRVATEVNNELNGRAGTQLLIHRHPQTHSLVGIEDGTGGKSSASTRTRPSPGQRAELQPDRRPIGDRKKRPVPIFPSSLAEHDDYYFQKIHAHPAEPPPPEPVLPPPKRHKSLSEQGSSGKVPDKSNWVLPEPLAKKGSRPPIFANHRQEICETLQYFRSYHAELYKRQGTVV
ncbi:hypothetical protein CROQUDRAFT_130595 [Cronartium quercuum f. sp. fusiforme G11]|uniref:Uncharacterized protein n=1 Tax=Cronartium quercuum f. sp. fusiforme G11 TaxID=708437 RepID=A0A9P6TG48_9BASI|nr:hypothetical protein CROQUDRAFT_130595 [Cronartium quercuum f. sp. fusiforme G11]